MTKKRNMIYKLFIMVVLLLAVMYYFSVVTQIFTNNKIKVTRREIKLGRALIPFYYWIK